jgi:acetyl-CoA acetyltransferase
MRASSSPAPTILPYERPYGALFPISGYAMVTQRHMHEYGTTREQLAKVTVAASQWASLNPEALKPEAARLSDVLVSAARQRSAAQARHLPRHRRRRCDRAHDARPREEIRQGAPSACSGHRREPQPLLRDQHAELHADCRRAVRPRAYEMAGLGPQDIDVAQIYDAFTIMVVLGLEDLGFCRKGEGGRNDRCGHRAGLQLPVNTTGGGLRYCHPGMFGIFLLVEGVRQLRNECGKRQVANARTALAHGFGGVLAGNATVILARHG